MDCSGWMIILKTISKASIMKREFCPGLNSRKSTCLLFSL